MISVIFISFFSFLLHMKLIKDHRKPKRPVKVKNNMNVFASLPQKLMPLMLQPWVFLFKALAVTLVMKLTIIPVGDGDSRIIIPHPGINGLTVVEANPSSACLVVCNTTGFSYNMTQISYNMSMKLKLYFDAKQYGI